MTNEEVGARLKLAIEGTLEMTGACLNKVLLDFVNKGRMPMEDAEEVFKAVEAEVGLVITEANRINTHPTTQLILPL